MLKYEKERLNKINKLVQQRDSHFEKEKLRNKLVQRDEIRQALDMQLKAKRERSKYDKQNKSMTGRRL